MKKNIEKIIEQIESLNAVENKEDLIKFIDKFKKIIKDSIKIENLALNNEIEDLYYDINDIIKSLKLASKRIYDEMKYIIKFKFISKEFNNLLFKILILNDCKLKFSFKKEYLEVIGYDSFPVCFFNIKIPLNYFEFYYIQSEKSLYIDLSHFNEFDELDDLENLFSGYIYFLVNKNNELILKRQFGNDIIFKNLNEIDIKKMNNFSKKSNHYFSSFNHCYFSIKKKYFNSILNIFNSYNSGSIKFFINQNNIYFNSKDIITMHNPLKYLNFKINKRYLEGLIVKKISKINVRNCIINNIFEFLKIENYEIIKFEIISLFMLKMKIKTTDGLEAQFYIAPSPDSFEEEKFDKLKIKYEENFLNQEA